MFTAEIRGEAANGTVVPHRPRRFVWAAFRRARHGNIERAD